MKISIIVPCYNSAQYIPSCALTLVNQSYSDWEAIFVNDGSFDKTDFVLAKLAAQDQRIKVYSQSNQGAAKAREYGISKATGDYITFLDVDDTLPVYALEKMINAFDDNVDIVVSGFNIVKQDKILRRRILKEQKLESLAYLKRVLCGKYGWELWAKMYRREIFLHAIKTPVGIRIGEDAAIFIQLIAKARSVRILSDQLYNYIQYEKSTSHVKSLKYAEETLQAAFFIEQILKEMPFVNEIKSEISAMFLLFYSNSTRKGVLGKQHPLVCKIRTEHFTWSAFKSIPFYKAFYVALSYVLS